MVDRGQSPDHRPVKSGATRPFFRKISVRTDSILGFQVRTVSLTHGQRRVWFSSQQAGFSGCTPCVKPSASTVIWPQPDSAHADCFYRNLDGGFPAWRATGPMIPAAGKSYRVTCQCSGIIGSNIVTGPSSVSIWLGYVTGSPLVRVIVPSLTGSR